MLDAAGTTFMCIWTIRPQYLASKDFSSRVRPIVAGDLHRLPQALCLYGSFNSYIKRSANSRRAHLLLSSIGGRLRSHAHLACSTGSSSPESMATTYFPMTGKNLYPWKDPHVAMNRPSHAEWGDTIKSSVGVQASLAWCQRNLSRRVDANTTYQQIL